LSVSQTEDAPAIFINAFGWLQPITAEDAINERPRFIDRKVDRLDYLPARPGIVEGVHAAA